MMARIFGQEQCRQLDADLEELSRYRALGMTPEKIEELLFPEPAPAPLSLYDPALEAQEAYGQDRWDK